MAGVAGLEPTTRGFGDRCSTNWATPLRGSPYNFIIFPYQNTKKYAKIKNDENTHAWLGITAPQ